MDMKRHRYNERLQRVFKRFGSFGETFNHYRSICERDSDLKKVVFHERDTWCGGSWEDLKKIADSGGWSEPVERSRGIASKISTAVNSCGVRPCWRSDVVGAFPDVPAFVAGAPESMRRRDVRADNNSRAPLSLWVGIGASSIVSSCDMERRGALVLAAYLALSRVRRVRLHVYTPFDRGNFIIDFGENFSVSELCAVLVSPNFGRRIGVLAAAYSVQCQSNKRKKNTTWRVGWAEWSHDVSQTADVLGPYGFRDGDVILCPGDIGNWDGKTDDEMIAEINGFVRRAVRVER